jgi:preprotein translocase subunit SecD
MRVRGLVFVPVVLSLLTGCAGKREETEAQRAGEGRPVTLRFHLASTEEVEGWGQMLDERGFPLFVAPWPLLTERHVSRAAVLSSETRHMVRVELTPNGQGILGRATRENLGRRLAIFIDGVLALSPTIRSEISGGVAMINGDFTAERARAIADGLNLRRSAEPTRLDLQSP